MKYGTTLVSHLLFLLAGFVTLSLVRPETVQIGTPVTSIPIGSKRRLLQLECPDNMIMQDGQCVCAQNYYSSVSTPKIIINSTEFICSGITPSINLGASCGATFCPTATSVLAYGGSPPQNAVNYNYHNQWDLFYGNAPADGDSWFRLDMLESKSVGGGKLLRIAGKNLLRELCQASTRFG